MPSMDGKFSVYHILRDTRRSSKPKSAQSDAPTDQGAQVGQEIDLQTLADKVYKLLKQELELEQERLGRSRRW